MSNSALYQIHVLELLGDEWTEWFAPLTIVHELNGGATLTGPLEDQAALHGILARVRNLNLTLLSVQRVEAHGVASDVQSPSEASDARYTVGSPPRRGV